MNINYLALWQDRLALAEKLARGRRVLDIGGQHPMNHAVQHPFGAAYRRISDAAADYEIFDRDAKSGVKYAGDLNTAEGRTLLRSTIQTYRPQLVLCMEILEHLTYSGEVMDILAGYLTQEPGAEILVTIPNNGNWVINFLNWHSDHNVAFFKTVAMRFVGRSSLGTHAIAMYPCMQRYRWYWWIVLLLAIGQPISWAFHITHGPEAPNGTPPPNRQ